MKIRRSWIQTYRGSKFYPLASGRNALSIEQPFDIRDIARALSMQCRYLGHVKRFYCPTPEQRVLTASLEWVPAGMLKAGDELLGFDEFPVEPGAAGKRRRRFRPSRVLTALMVRRRVIRLELSDGSAIRASEEHPWLVATKASNNQTWQTAGEVAVAVRAGRKRYVNRLMDVWQTANTREAGWLAGMYDGEGHLSFIDRRGVQMGLAQRPGRVLDHARDLHGRLGFKHRVSSVGSSDVQSVQVLGGWRQYARLLGTVRPMRLLHKFQEGLRTGQFAKQLTGLREPLEVVASYDEGEAWVAGLETSTRTYFCEGFGAHNSVAEHSVRVSELVERDLARGHCGRPLEHTGCHLCKRAARWALIHDASEAYLGDVPSPLKHQVAFELYREAEARLQTGIAAWLGLPLAEPEIVRHWDRQILGTEARQLKAPLHPDYAEGYPGGALPPVIKGLRVGLWTPRQAERAFLRRFARLFPEHKS